MKTRLILKPGQPGTKRLVEKYGDYLLCVRFKYDAESRQRLKTVELIVERTKRGVAPPLNSSLCNKLKGEKIEECGNGIKDVICFVPI